MTNELRKREGWVTWVTGANICQAFHTFEDACQDAKGWADAIVRDYPPPSEDDPEIDYEDARMRYDEIHEILVIAEVETEEELKHYVSGPADMWQVIEGCDADTDPAAYADHVVAIFGFDAC